jgi:hypothetical protein
MVKRYRFILRVFTVKEAQAPSPLLRPFSFKRKISEAFKEVLRRENQGLKICPVDGF